MGLHANSAILGCTMVQHPVPRAPKNGQSSQATTSAADDPPLTAKQQRALAHSRGRICKKQGCDVCAPLREQRRLAKAKRKADAQAKAHAKGQPCGRNNCPVPVCVKAQHADPVDPAPPAPPRESEATGAPTDDSGRLLRRQTERHRVGLPCGVQSCPNEICVEGFAQERVRRHRARRPCKSLDCTNPVCRASRSKR